MKSGILILLLSIICIYSCKNEATNVKLPKEKTVLHKDSTLKAVEDPNASKMDSAKQSMMDMLPLNIVPPIARQNWAFSFAKDKKHSAGIFILKNEQDLRDFMAQLDYAPPKDVKASMVYEPKTDWWQDREIKTNIVNNTLACYRKKDGNSLWYFAIHKSREIYFWK